MKELIYTRYGKPYRKIGRNEVILEGYLHSFCGGELHPIITPETIGDAPSSFSDEREFFVPLEISL